MLLGATALDLVFAAEGEDVVAQRVLAAVLLVASARAIVVVPTATQK